MSKAEKTKQYIIEKTAPLFNTKGYFSTSLSDITQITGLTKGSIYGNFENKDELALKVFQYNSGTLKKKLSTLLNENHLSSLDKLYIFVDFYRKNWKSVFKNGGCPLMNAATEADDTFPALNDQVKSSFEEWSKTITKIIKTGQESKEFYQEINAEEYASIFIVLIEGGILLSKTTEDERHLNLALDRIIKLIDNEIKKNP
ncbi:TetR/AcrR family transcriptional regulator [Chryseobacterium oryctis]|uniref:TetR/AcrR family transcriptional regulator n=1 Tax=Chryseobacterium oryctis TaxID=2952618 RepID=A0ABT3HL26_9FLAO|nr:TetR/AcrR family transcriptional regulator [Chryseobacterium oryctis]MCW3160494.1 TetR/AcrR family transcriptional regulator [Chryseobacterium oryctis]